MDSFEHSGGTWDFANVLECTTQSRDLGTWIDAHTRRSQHLKLNGGGLQGHIALDQAVFPEGTSGLALDTLARRPLWSLGLNYRHGTGHGVGAALNVHEGPHSISPR